MNKYQKVLNKSVRINIKLFPKWGNGSFYKRRKLFRKLAKQIYYESRKDGRYDCGDARSVQVFVQER